MTDRLSAADVGKMLDDAGEPAFIDVREIVIAYLDWEDGLLAEIERGGPAPSRNLIWP